MLMNTPLINAINNRDFATATTLLKNGEQFPETLNDFDRRQLYETTIRNKGFTVIDVLVDAGVINPDVYEYDSFRNSIFELFFKYMSVEDESIRFLNSFIAKLYNINDEVEGHTLLSYAIECWADPSIIQCLIDAGLRTDFRNTAEDNLVSQSVRLNMIPKDRQLAYLAIFIKAGVDVNEGNVVKQTALHIAVESDKDHLLGILLANGAKPNEQDDKGNSSFYYALAHKLNGTIYNILTTLEPADFMQQNREGQTILSEYMRMLQGGSKEVALLEQLVTDGADLEQTAPYYGNPKSGWDWAVDKPIEVLQMLLKKTGRDINTQDNEGNTLLHKVCAIDTNYSQEKAKELYKKAKLLLEAGADISVTNTKDETAFILASKDNLKIKLVELLLAAKK